MTLLVTIAFIMAVAGCFIMLELSPFAFLEGLSGYLRPKNHSMKNRIKESKKKKEPKGLKLLFEEVKEILRLTGKSEQYSTGTSDSSRSTALLSMRCRNIITS